MRNLSTVSSSIFVAILASSSAVAQNLTVTAHSEEIELTIGAKVQFELYNSEMGFDSGEPIIETLEVVTRCFNHDYGYGCPVSTVYDDLPAGQYAVFVYVDEHDYDWEASFDSESYGLSNNPNPSLWDMVSFAFDDEDMEIFIEIMEQ